MTCVDVVVRLFSLKIMPVVAILAMMLGVQHCKTQAQATELMLTLTSSVPNIDTIHIRARDFNDTHQDVQTLDATGRDLSSDPMTLLITPSALAQVGETGFMVSATGTRQNVQVAGGVAIAVFKLNQRVEQTITLGADFTDNDNDGFAACNATADPLCDCVDQNKSINPFVPEVCNDDIDNNCTGFPPDEGCACTQDKPCTVLDQPDWKYAGVGACTFGTLACDRDTGILSTVCEGAGRRKNEDCGPDGTGNGIDDDCDGTVDNNCTCTATTPRNCLRGEIGAEADLLAKGACQTGNQACTGGKWGTCDKTTAPSRDLTQSPMYRESSCDGLDNDCNGFVDELNAFDTDGDGYTTCGTCDPKVNGIASTRFNWLCSACLPTKTSSPWVCDEAKDCNDADGNIHPGATEICGNNDDEDCRCDHGANLGKAYTQCPLNTAPDDHYLDCARSGARSGDGETGMCSDSTSSGVVYYAGYFSDTNGTLKPDTKAGDCYTCGDPYGESCSSGVCSTHATDCLGCTTPVSGAATTSRPTCTVPDITGCTGTKGALWTDAVDGTDPTNDCPDIDCSSTTPGPYYFGTENDTNGVIHCYKAGTATGLCASNRSCQTADTACATAAKGAEDTTGRTTCQVFASGCTDTTAPTWTDTTAGTDPFDECTGAINCAGNGTCYLKQGAPCTQATDKCESGFCVDGVCCDTACDGNCDSCNDAGSEGTCKAAVLDACTGNCDDCTQNTAKTSFSCTADTTACTGNCDVCQGGGTNYSCTADSTACTGNCSQCTGGGTNYSCTAKSTACTGDCDSCTETTTTTSTQFDCTTDVQGTPGAPSCAPYVCNGMDTTCPTSCTINNECSTGFCVEGVCCNTACNNTCYSCLFTNTSQADGTCSWINKVMEDTNAIIRCDSFGSGCYGNTCTCNGNAFSKCLGVLGTACTKHSHCLNGACNAGTCN